MKRSEMLSKIASVIVNYSVIKRAKALQLAETILQVQEDAGMLPPRIVKWDGVTSFGGITVIETWEPEDEEK